MKNNKGFTLVELIAAVVVLGLITILTLPSVINLLGTNRDKIYITDAKKMIAQADYRVRAASSEIEKPANGDCVIMSLKYLDNSDFEKAPNDGKYIREASFVVIKNNNGTMEYSVMLVEDMKKGGLKGVELSKDVDLNVSSTKHVVIFKRNDLLFTENGSNLTKYGGTLISSDQINNRINSTSGSKYVNEISNIYNYQDLSQDTYKGEFEPPKIVKAEFVSASNKKINTLDTIFRLTVKDDDTPLSNLKVIVSMGNYFPTKSSAVDCNINEGYPFGNKVCAYNYEDGINSAKEFELPIDFSKGGYSYNGDSVTLKIMVFDAEDNSDKIAPTYIIHDNEAPTINLGVSKLDKRVGDLNALDTALFSLAVSDDIDESNNLSVCYVEGNQATECSGPTSSGYHKFSELFPNGKNKEINLHCANNSNSKCEYNGSITHLTVFVKDSYGLETTHTFDYELYNNKAPVVSLSLEPVKKYSNGLNGLQSKVNLTVNDDSSAEKLTVYLSEKSDFSTKSTYKYSDFINGAVVNYTFSGVLDGNNRKLYVKVLDEYGKDTTANSNYTNVYKNQAPVIKEFSYLTYNVKDYVCDVSKNCSSKDDNGNLIGYPYITNVMFKITDDLVADDQLYYCLSENLSDCDYTTKLSTNFHKYDPSGIDMNYTFAQTGTPYDAATGNLNRKLYLVAYDGYNNNDSTLALSTQDSKDYKIYENQPPNIYDVRIVPEISGYNSRKVSVRFKSDDDLDGFSNLSYSLSTIDDTSGISNSASGNYVDSDDGMIVNNFNFTGKYDGVSRDLIVTLSDSYGSSNSLTSSYDIYEDEPPKITSFSVVSNGSPCGDEELCGATGSINTSVNLNVYDLVNSSDEMKYKICVDSKCGSYHSLADAEKVYQKDENGNNTSTLSHLKIDYSLENLGSKPYTGDTKKFNIVVRDESDLDATLEEDDEFSYELYKNKGPVISDGYPKISSALPEFVDPDNSENKLSLNTSTINFALEAKDEFISQKDIKYNICYTIDGESTENCLVKDLKNLYSFDDSGLISVKENLGISKLNGQTIYVYAKLYDDYALNEENGNLTENKEFVKYSSMYSYTLYRDTSPLLRTFKVERKDGISFSVISAEILIRDLLDEYQYCISDSSDASLCTNYSDYINGNNVDSFKVDYSTGWKNNFDSNKNFTLYLHIKDKNDNQVSFSGYLDRVPCGAVNDDDISSGIITKVEYSKYDNQTEISASYCKNKCYYWPRQEVSENVFLEECQDTKDFHSTYKRTILKFDRDDKDIACAEPQVEDYEAHCDFKDCFKVSDNNYVANVVGYNVYTSNSFSHTYMDENNESITCNKHTYRYLYKSRLNTNNQAIELDNVGTNGTKICDTHYLDKDFSFGSYPTYRTYRIASDSNPLEE